MVSARKKKKGIVILGSTGSVGRNTLEVLRALDLEFHVVGLSANRSWKLLLQQIEEFQPSRVALADGDSACSLEGNSLPDGTTVLLGRGGVEKLASDAEADFVLLAISGGAAIPAAIAALRAGKVLGLANKEVLVMAGELVVNMAKKYGAKIVPIDSEHNAIHQLLRTGRRNEVRRIILTASGGPFYDWPESKLRKVTVEQALRHPTWRMGQQITVNSATMINKAMEVVEAHWLFGLKADQIEILVHPEAIVHSIVEFRDGACFALLGPPDMRVPIQYALTEPRRVAAPHMCMNLAEVGSLTFRKPDFEKFPALSLGYQVLQEGGASGAVLCGANEAAVGKFVEGAITFPDIVDVVKRVMDKHIAIPQPTVEQIVAVGRWSAREVERLV